MDTARWYRRFADVEARDSSPAYRSLADHVAADPQVLQLIDRLPPPKRQPNLLFASVRFLGGPTSDWEPFRRFVLGRWETVEATMAMRSTQTNEPARCGALLPVLARIRAPIALIEVGASAGLCLFPDRYGYMYDGTPVGGDSAVRIEVATNGAVPIPTGLPDITWRRGIDLHPLDVTDAADVRWLDACVWPEHHERRDRLARAVEVVAEDPPLIVAGDLNTEIEELLDAAPTDAITVVAHSAVLAYLDPQDRETFGRTMMERPEVVWISNEAPGVVSTVVATSPPPTSNAFVVGLGGFEAVAYADPHGSRLHWLTSS